MKKGLLIAALLVAVLSAQANPAKPGWFTYVQPDGSTIKIQRHGDEWGHWTTDADGRVVRQQADGFYRVVEGMNATTASRLARVRQSAHRRVAASAPSKVPVAMGKQHFLLVLVEFSDLSFTLDEPQQAIAEMLDQEGYSKNKATGSARDYYFENSHGQFDPVFDVYGPVKLDKSYAYYGKNDKDGYDTLAYEAVRDACVKLEGTVDFSNYDIDGDGDVDLVYMIYAGMGEADSGDEDTIWPHQWYLYSGAGISLTMDGKRIDRYACGSELNGNKKQDGIGTICHEFGHAIGLPDFYDTDQEGNGMARTLLDYSVMDTGSYNNNGWTPPYLNMVERIMLGWVDESALQVFPKSGSYTLTTVQDNVAWKTPTDTEGEYFVYECRVKEGWDHYIPAAGMIVYHVDKSDREVRIVSGGKYLNVKASELWRDWRTFNCINENGSHPCFYIIAAAAPDDLMYGMKYQSGYGYYFQSSMGVNLPFPGGKKVTKYTPVSWNGVDSDYSFSNIVYANGQVSFQVEGPDANKLDYPLIANPGNGLYATGDNFDFALDLPEGYTAASVQWYFDSLAVKTSSVTLQAGTHTVEAEVKDGSGKKLILTLEIKVVSKN